MANRKRPIDVAEAYQAVQNATPIERVVLGTAIVDQEVMDSIADHLHRGDMSSHSHQVIWDEMVVLYREGTLSTDMLISSLAARGTLDGLGKDFSDVGKATGEAYIRLLASQRTPDPDYFISMLEGEITRRSGSEIAQLVLAELGAGVRDPREVIEEGQRRMENAIKARTTGGVSIGNLLTGLDERIDAQIAGTFEPAYEWKVITALKQYIEFLENEDYFIFATRPGGGKSSVIRAEFASSAAQNQPSVIVNLENSEIQYASFVVAMFTGINAAKLKDATKLTEPELARVRQAIKDLKGIPLQILTMSAPSGADVVREFKALAKTGFKNFAVDYVQLMRNGLANPVDDISTSSHALRGVALKIHRPIFAVAQLSRAIEHRGDGNPQLSDLRGSGDLENDATHVGFIWEAWSNPSEAQIMAYPENRNYRRDGIIVAKPIQIHIAKARNDAIGTTAPFVWNKSTNQFHEIERL